MKRWRVESGVVPPWMRERRMKGSARGGPGDRAGGGGPRGSTSRDWSCRFVRARVGAAGCRCRLLGGGGELQGSRCATMQAHWVDEKEKGRGCEGTGLREDERMSRGWECWGWRTGWLDWMGRRLDRRLAVCVMRSACLGRLHSRIMRCAMLLSPGM